MSRLSEIQKQFTKLFGWRGDRLAPVDFAMSAFASTYLTGKRERTWGILVGGPSSGKTAILESLRDSNPRTEGPRRVVPQGDLTENAFASGFRSEDDPDSDPSLLAKLDFRRNPEGPKMLVATEMAAVLGLPPARRSRFFSQMRMAYDGEYDNNTGNVGHVWYDLGFGFLGASTEKIYEVMREDQPVGQRTVLCRMNRWASRFEEDRDLSLRAIQLDPYHKASLARETRELVVAHLEATINEVRALPEYTIHHPAKYEQGLADVNTLVTRLRTVPTSAHHLTFDGEKPPRISGQLVTWGDGRAALDGRRTWTDEDFAIVRRIAQDTLPPEFLSILKILWGRGDADAEKGCKSEVISRRCRITDSFHRQWDQWVLSGVVTIKDNNVYALHSQIIEAISRCDFLADL